MPAAVSCVTDAMVVFVLACCWKNFPIVRQILNTENPVCGIVFLPPFEFHTKYQVGRWVLRIHAGFSNFEFIPHPP